MSTLSLPRTRITALDMTKGLLVVFMVAYHGLNYSNEYYLGFKYLSFLPPSFIIISGFIISNIYSVKYDPRDARLHKRLVTRGVKLLVLFTALNLASQLVKSGRHYGHQVSPGSFFEHWYDVYVLGSRDYAAFGVLVPISYLLMIAPIIIRLTLVHRYFLPAFAFLFVISCAVEERLGYFSFNVSLLSAGVFGMLLGRLPLSTINSLAQFPLLLIAAYFACYYIGNLSTETYLIQILGATVALAALYAVSTKVGDRGWAQRQLILLGQYSLLAYIAQIAILQILSFFVGRPDPLSWAFGALFISTLILMTVAIVATDRARASYQPLDRLYRAIFL